MDKHQSELIKRVSNVGPILDELLCRNVIQHESYDKIKLLPTAEEKMRSLIYGSLNSVPGKDIFYQILIENEPFLVEDLKRMDVEVSKSSYINYYSGSVPSFGCVSHVITVLGPQMVNSTEDHILKFVRSCWSE